jgi:hypothetical protein
MPVSAQEFYEARTQLLSEMQGREIFVGIASEYIVHIYVEDRFAGAIDLRRFETTQAALAVCLLLV